MPPPPLVDFCSDTVTRPVAAMRKAMANAEVGDEQQREDPARQEGRAIPAQRHDV